MITRIGLGFFLFGLALSSSAQTNGDSILQQITLKQAINYAINNQPVVQQSLLDEDIATQQIRSRLADMYPQLNSNFTYQHTFIRQTSVIGGNNITLGVRNTSGLQFLGSQQIFNRDIRLVKRTRNDVLQQAKQNTVFSKIDLSAMVAKAFYDILSTMQQIRVADANIIRIERSLKDAYNQYLAGITDKTDYKRATITLNNSKASKKSNENLLVAKKEYLKSLMNYPQKEDVNIQYDSLQMEREIMLDTLQTVDIKNRIEYTQLQTTRRLLLADLDYNRWAYLPNLSANGAYIFNFQNNNVAKLYNTTFPNAYAGITLGFPIFQGGRRKANTQIAQLNLNRNELALKDLDNTINREYAQALAVYKSNYVNYITLKENVALAQEVYDVIQLQYRAGIKTYLEVLTSDTDLRTAQINYYNAVYDLLASKIDVEKALGNIVY